jgi:hypothetical protein
LQELFEDVSLAISEKWQLIWQSPGRSILIKILISILGILMIPLIFALVFPILIILVFVIPGFFLIYRWISIIGDGYYSGASSTSTGDMKVATFYSSDSDINVAAYTIMMSVVGIVFGGIHCIGWFFNFPSSEEAMLWRVSSAVLTGIAALSTGIVVLIPLLLKTIPDNLWCYDFLPSIHPAIFILSSIIMFLAYVVSRLLLLVEAFISLRHLTPGMLALVKWTSFIPHI